jgi:hypothetical protein
VFESLEVIATLRMCRTDDPNIFNVVMSSLASYCWSSPAQSFLVSISSVLITIFYCLTTLGVVQPLSCVVQMTLFLITGGNMERTHVESK